MADTKKKKNLFQKIAQIAKEFQEWVEETFGDPELAAEIKDELGLNPANPATPAPVDPARKAKIDAFVAKEDIDEAALGEVIADIKATVDTVFTFVDAVKADGVDPWTLFWAMFKVFALDVLRVRNPAGYALVRLAGLVTEDDETLHQLDAAALSGLVRGEATEADGEALVQRLSMLGGVTIVLLATFWSKLDGAVDALYGWDPDPGEEGDAAVVASRALTVVLENEVLGGVRPALTLIGVPKGHGGPGLFLSATTAFQLPMTVGDTTYTTEITGAGQFGLFIGKPVRAFASFAPAIRISVEPRAGSDQPADAPALVVGTTDSTRLQIGAFAFGVELAGDRAAFRAAIRKGKLVVALGDGDSFLRQLPGGNVEIPFDLGLIADTANGIRFEGGTGLRVNLPVSASLFGVFTVQFLELELKFTPKTSLDLTGGFSVKLGPFAASIDRAGLTVELDAISRGVDNLGDLVKFAPPKGIGLALDAAVVKGGGYLFIDAARGEYAGALELKFLTFSIKAIGLLSTKRPDGSEGWSLLLFVFGQFSVHIAFGIFWTGLGGMIGLHHRADVDALTAGMRTGALDDILFPDNPVADAPRIINRYRTLFPVSEGGLLVGPMLELSFSQPPIVYLRIGLIADVRNALGGDRPAALSRVIILGQVLVQLPPKATGAPAILKLLIDVVGSYEADTQFLLIRARLRDSFVGIEGLAKIDLAGELLIAAQFGSDPSFILSAGGFHPKFKDLPERVPRDLDRLRTSFKLGPVKLSVEQYFAVTPNSVQAGWKASLSADFGVASVEASLAFDALLYLSPRFFFVVDVEFKAKVKAFGRTLASVEVNATVEGPDEWHVFGKFSFSILWWDKTVSFDERWGDVKEVDAGTVSVAQALKTELENPDNLAPEGPVGGASLVTLAPAGNAATTAHPLGRLAVRQRAVPFGLRVDRLGTKRIQGGPTTVTVQSLSLNGAPLATFESTTESFAPGQFMELSETEKLTGQSFETFPCGVVVGRADYTTARPELARDVTASFETIRLDPEPRGLISKWSTIRIGLVTPVSYEVVAR
ncbi:MAG: hypothetical protein LC733_09170 [Actinobacteria bacterium]|nr:hypothetical protein [Actinomycetota bacterium]